MKSEAEKEQTEMPLSGNIKSLQAHFKKKSRLIWIVQRTNAVIPQFKSPQKLDMKAKGNGRTEML